MRWFTSRKFTWLAVSALAVGLLVGWSRRSAAWQGTRSLKDIDSADQPDQPQRGNGWLELAKCQISLIDAVVLAADRPGVVAYVEPEEGDAVKANTHIVGLKDEVAAALLKVAKEKAENDVSVRFGKASAEVAKKSWEKNVETNRRVPGTVPEVEVEKSYLDYKKTLLQTENAEHELKVAALEVQKSEAELAAMKVEAPFDGTVRRILKRKGEAVKQGDPILELISTRRVKVEGYLPIEDIWTVKPGDTVQVQIDIPGRDVPIEKEIFEGKVVFVDPNVSRVTHGARVWAEVQNHGKPQRLVEGLYAKMKILHGQRTAGSKSNIQQVGGTK